MNNLWLYRLYLKTTMFKCKSWIDKNCRLTDRSHSMKQELSFAVRGQWQGQVFVGQRLLRFSFYDKTLLFSKTILYCYKGNFLNISLSKNAAWRNWRVEVAQTTFAFKYLAFSNLSTTCWFSSSQHYIFTVISSCH